MESDSSSYSSSNNNNSPPYIPPIKRSGSQYVNDEHTHKNFCWHTEGKQPVVWRKNQKKYIKLYYRCSERKNGCMAKKAIHQVPGEPIASYSHFHNHPPIYNTQEKEEENRIAPEIREGYNLIPRYGGSFLRVLQILPNVHFGLVSDYGLATLASSESILLEDNQELANERYSLTTVMTIHEGVPVPCAYLISSALEVKNYLQFMRELQHMTSNTMKPKVIYMNLELGLEESMKKIFPLCEVKVDFSQFLKANQRKLKQIHLTSYIKKISIDLQTLYNTSEKEFKNELDKFISKWSNLSDFIHYFQSVWVEEHPPSIWANYSNLTPLPSYGYYYRIKKRLSEIKGGGFFDNLIGVLNEEDEEQTCLLSKLDKHVIDEEDKETEQEDIGQNKAMSPIIEESESEAEEKTLPLSQNEKTIQDNEEEDFINNEEKEDNKEEEEEYDDEDEEEEEEEDLELLLPTRSKKRNSTERDSSSSEELGCSCGNRNKDVGCSWDKCRNCCFNSNKTCDLEEHHQQETNQLSENEQSPKEDMKDTNSSSEESVVKKPKRSHDFSIKHWLRSICLDRYSKNFKNTGFDIIHAVKSMDINDLKNIGVTLPGHVKTIINEAKKL